MSEDLSGQILLERYQVLKRIGEGGMGEVYLAISRGAAGVTRPVVIKRMLSALNTVTDARVMFEREARILSLMNHPGIVRVTEFGVGPDASYLMVMDYVEGADLLEIMARQPGLMPVPLALHIMIETLDAMEYAHTLTDQSGAPLGVVHRDISASNILIDCRGRVVLLDFGVAKSKFDPVKTATNQYKGKFAYMAPELIALTAEASAATDVYSLAVVFHEVLLGRNVMYADELRTAFAKVMNHIPERVDLIRKDVPAGLADVIARSLEKDATRRFTSARAFRDALIPFRTAAVEALREQLGTFARTYFSPPPELAQFFVDEKATTDRKPPPPARPPAVATKIQAPQQPPRNANDGALAATMVGSAAQLDVGELKIHQQPAGQTKPSALAAVMRPGAGGLLGFDFEDNEPQKKLELGDRSLPTPAKLVDRPRAVPVVASKSAKSGYSKDEYRRRAMWFGIGGLILLGVAAGSYSMYSAQVRAYNEHMAAERVRAAELLMRAGGGGQGGSEGPTANTGATALPVAVASDVDAGALDADTDGDVAAPGGGGHIWVVAAHPGDEALIAANAIANGAKASVPITVIVLTNGDAECSVRGDLREGETIDAMASLGLIENNVEFLGYPDGHLSDLGSEPTNLYPRLDAAGRCTPSNTTAASRGNGHATVRSRRTHSDGPYLRAELEADLTWLHERDHPTEIYLPSIEDGNVDHVITNVVVRRVLLAEESEATLHRAGRENGTCVAGAAPRASARPADNANTQAINGRGALSLYRSQPHLQAFVAAAEQFDSQSAAAAEGSPAPNLFSCAVGLAPCYSDCRLMVPTRTPTSIIVPGCPNECTPTNYPDANRRDYICGDSLEWTQVIRTGSSR